MTCFYMSLILKLLDALKFEKQHETITEMKKTNTEMENGL